MKYVLFNLKRCFQCVVFAVVFINVQLLFPEDLNWFLDTAVKNDYQLKVLKINLKNTQLEIKKNNLDSVLSLTILVDNTGLSYSWADEASAEPLSIYSSPSVTLGLADPLETQITAGTDARIYTGGQNGTSSLKLYPGLSINQPLNKFLGLENSTDAQDLSDKISVKQGEIAVLKREIELKTLVLNKLKTLYSAEKELKTINVNIMDAKKTFNDAEKLGTYSPESVKYMQLKYALSRLKREKITAEETLKSRRADLEMAVGSKFVSLPEILPDVKLELPSLNDIKRNPDMYIAYLRILKDKAKLKEQSASEVPQLSTGVSVARTSTGSPDISGEGNADTDISGTFKGIFEDFSVSASIGGTIDSKTIYLKTGFSWALPDNRIKDIDKGISRNTIESDELQVKLLEHSFRSKISAIKLELKDFENRNSNLKENREIAELNLKDAKTQFDNGMISVEGVKDAQWQLDSLEYDKKALLLDKLITGQDIDSLVLLK